MDRDFAVSCPLVRPGLPHIRFLFVRSRLRSTLPSDPASRRRPCASLALHLHQAVQGTCTPRLSNMLGTQLSRCAAKKKPFHRPRLLGASVAPLYPQVTYLGSMVNPHSPQVRLSDVMRPRSQCGQTSLSRSRRT